MTKRGQLLEEELERFLAEKGYCLEEEQKREVLKILRVFLKPSVEGGGWVSTKDGSFTLIDKNYGEPYHSLTAGAITECIKKFVEPSEVLYRAEKEKLITVVDVGFGLGYNAAVLLKKLRDINKKVEVHILSFEKRLLDEVLPPPEEYKPYWLMLWENLPEFQKDGIHFKLLLGDARKKIKEVVNFGADAILHDAFSPYKNPELWSLEFLKEITKLLKPDGVWVSYTSSLAVRKALKTLGFNLQNTKAVGRKTGGTKAGISIEERLTETDLRKLSTSPYAIPFLDPSLDRKPIHILIDYSIRVVYNRRQTKEVGS
ncbi:MnmC family methyltransferase [Thermocrinis sp.]|uniref:tRNA (5-methylaminomethyl-2-thiouridine)(34)-methyltransferase MnmD n=1 Tax=Thermocrinis sp. TaxID=2024383 RepID=UPI002FDDEA7F